MYVYSLSVKHLIVTLRLAFVLGLFFKLGLGFLCMSPRGEELGGYFVTFFVRNEKSKETL